MKNLEISQRKFMTQKKKTERSRGECIDNLWMVEGLYRRERRGEVVELVGEVE